MRIISKADVQQAMDMAACIEVNTTAFIAVATGRAKVPVKHHIPVESQAGAVALFMPGYLPDEAALGVKVVSVFPENRAKGLPGTVGAIMLVSAETGEPVALMDGTWLTSLRTGAGTGVATQLMARPDSKVLALLGAGSMGFHQVEAVLAVRPVDSVLIWNRTPARAEELAEEVAALCRESGKTVKVQAVTDPEAAVRQSDIVVASTASATPVVLGEWVRAGTHVNLIGAHGADMREGDDALLLKSGTRAVDAFDSSAASGELRIPLAAGVVRREDFVDLGAIAAGKVSGRNRSDEITWFKSVGLAAQDMACAAHILRTSEQRDLGIVIEL